MGSLGDATGFFSGEEAKKGIDNVSENRGRCMLNGFLVSKETVVLRRWGRSKQKFWFYQTS